MVQLPLAPTRLRIGVLTLFIFLGWWRSLANLKFFVGYSSLMHEIVFEQTLTGTQYPEDSPGPGLRAELMHPDHVDSPLRSNSKEKLTDIARIRDEVAQTAAREEFVHEQVTKKLPAYPGGSRRARRTPLQIVEMGAESGNNSTRAQLENSGAGHESIVSMTGAGYSMKISIGTPPQNFTAFADTGSNLAWIQCSPCEHCFLQDERFFDPTSSSSFQTVNCASSVCEELQQLQNFAGCDSRCTASQGCHPGCQYEFEYGDQTHSSGDLAIESLALSDDLIIPGFIFGCGHDNKGSLNQTGASGIVGLGRGDLSFPSQLKRYMSARFSTCFVDRETALRKTSPILFGDMAPGPWRLPGMQYTPMVSGNNSVEAFYYVNLEGISVGSQRVPMIAAASSQWSQIFYSTVKTQTSKPSARLQEGHGNQEAAGAAGFSIDPATGEGGTILDSGSTLTSLESHVYSRVVEEFLKQAPVGYPRADFSSHGLDICFVIKPKSKSGVKRMMRQLPSLTFHLTDADWTMPHKNMALVIRDGEHHRHRGMYMCVALTKSKYSMNIMNVQQQNFHIVYDLENERIGFARDDCGSV